jgi:hypothetical protein
MKQAAYDVTPDFLIQPCREGIRLSRPSANSQDSALCVGKLNDISAQAHFTNLEHECAAVNQRSIESGFPGSMKRKLLVSFISQF